MPPASPTAAEAIQRLPSNYAQLPRGSAGDDIDGAAVPPLGPPLPGDIGAIAIGTNNGHLGAQSLSAYEQALLQQRLESIKRAEKAREAGFEFAGGASAGMQGSSGETGSDALGALVRDPAAAANQTLAGMTHTTGDRDSDNRQDDKMAFLDQGRKPRSPVVQGVQWPASPYTMFAGTILPGVLITGINSDLPGQIEGQISQNVYDTVTGTHLLLPQGTRVLGTYDSRITYGQSRVLVVWTRLIRPDGSNIDLDGMAGVDLSGYAGVSGKVDRHLGRLLTAVVLGSIIQAGAESGTNYTFPTYTDLARQGAGEGVNQATQQIVRKELSVQPTIEVAPGTRFNVFTTQDIVLPPYEDRHGNG